MEKRGDGPEPRFLWHALRGESISQRRLNKRSPLVILQRAFHSPAPAGTEEAGNSRINLALCKICLMHKDRGRGT